MYIDACNVVSVCECMYCVLCSVCSDVDIQTALLEDVLKLLDKAVKEVHVCFMYV